VRTGGTECRRTRGHGRPMLGARCGRKKCPPAQRRQSLQPHPVHPVACIAHLHGRLALPSIGAVERHESGLGRPPLTSLPHLHSGFHTLLWPRGSLFVGKHGRPGRSGHLARTPLNPVRVANLLRKVNLGQKLEAEVGQRLCTQGRGPYAGTHSKPNPAPNQPQHPKCPASSRPQPQPAMPTKLTQTNQGRPASPGGEVGEPHMALIHNANAPYCG
jgi:hypothetical protein